MPRQRDPQLKIGRDNATSNQGGNPRTFALKLVGGITQSPFQSRPSGQILTLSKQILHHIPGFPSSYTGYKFCLMNTERILPSSLIKSREGTVLDSHSELPAVMWDIAQRSGLGPYAQTGCHQNVGSRVASWRSSCWLSLLFRFTLNLFLQPPYSNGVTIIIFHALLLSKRDKQMSLRRISCCPQKHMELGGGIWDGKSTQSVWI